MHGKSDAILKMVKSKCSNDLLKCVNVPLEIFNGLHTNVLTNAYLQMEGGGVVQQILNSIVDLLPASCLR